MVAEMENQSVKDEEDNTAQEEPGESVPEEEPQGCTATLYQFTEDPESSQAAYVWSLLILFLILVGTITLIIETLPDMSTDEAVFNFFVIESICVAFFTIEMILRLIGWEFSIKFLQEPMNIIDLLAVVPFYADLIIVLTAGIAPGSPEAAGNGNTDSTRVLRLFRLIRVFRVFKLSRNSPTMRLAVKAVVASFDTLVLMIMILLFMVIFFGSIVYTFEKGTWHDEYNEYRRKGEDYKSPYVSIPEGMWWCLCTIMTVGYGDVYPTTDLGKLFATVTIVCSVVILALPISVIGLNFSLMWMSSKQQSIVKEDPTKVERSQTKLMRELILYTQDIDTNMRYLREVKCQCEAQLQELSELLEQQPVDTEELKIRLLKIKFSHLKMENLREKCLRLVPVSSKDPDDDDFSSTGYYVLITLMQRAQSNFEWVRDTIQVSDHVEDDLYRMSQFILIEGINEETRGCFSASPPVAPEPEAITANKDQRSKSRRGSLSSAGNYEARSRSRRGSAMGLPELPSSPPQPQDWQIPIAENPLSSYSTTGEGSAAEGTAITLDAVPERRVSPPRAALQRRASSPQAAAPTSTDLLKREQDDWEQMARQVEQDDKSEQM